jgi:class 3 adenylate cyclase/HAMP domain-containing protein/CHASE3 domain sensor protein
LAEKEASLIPALPRIGTLTRLGTRISSRRRWRDLSVTTKFGAAFATFLSLIITVALISFISLTVVRRQVQDSIVASMEIQRLVLQMDATLQHARLLQRDFFLRWPEIGFEKAKQTYVRANHDLIQQVTEFSNRLRQSIADSDVSTALLDRKVDVNFFLSAARRYDATFSEAVDLVSQLAGDQTGAQARLDAVSAALYAILHDGDDTLALALFREMQAAEKNYMATRNRPLLQSAINVGNQLSRRVWASPSFDAGQRRQVADYLTSYDKVATEIGDLDAQIRSLFKEFDLQDQAINPISEELITLAKAEVARSQAKLDRTSRWTTLVIFGVVGGALALAAFVVRLLHLSFTRNVVKLTRAVGELQRGKLATEANIDSGDELGRLAVGFNDMAGRIRALVKSLQEQAAIAESRLYHAIESMSQGFALYDARDLLVLFNSRYRSLLYPGIEESVATGASFEAIVRNAAESGLIPDAQGRVDEWVAQRIREHRKPGRAMVQQRSDGRWVEVSEDRTADGDTVALYTDVTERKEFELRILEEKRRADEASSQATEKNRMLESLSAKLSKYLSPQVYSSIFTGRQDVAISSKRKRLTVFFSDIADFTETTDSLESEQLTEVLNHYLTEMSKIALEFGATIDKYIGDAILIFFGDPETKGTKEDAAACVAMAVAMQRRMRELRAQWLAQGLERPFELRIGINTGFCTVGNFGSEDRMDYTIVGNEVNLAARLQAHAKLGGILLAHETYSLVRDAFSCIEREPVQVKGFSKPIRNYEVLGIHPTEKDAPLQREEAGFRLEVDLEKLKGESRVAAIRAIEEALRRLRE